MTEIKDEKPSPGSDEAVDMGCSCPIGDNCRGAGVFGCDDHFWIDGACPLHAGEK